jgi:glyoxylase-like metal-dependent hydrolase (beta-lactamase superfamily II)
LTGLPAGIRRLTFPLPLGIGHVHCYLLPGSDGWTLVDTGLGLPDAESRWEPVLEELDAPVARIVVTHFHPDHAGGGADAEALTGARVLQGAHDYEQCEAVWGSSDWSERLAEYLQTHGLPEAQANELRLESRLFAPFIRFARDPERLAEGDEVDGWTVLELPGHADGHICLLLDGILVAGDHLLTKITPTVGLYPDSRPDPLGDYLASLERTIELAPIVALAGHNDTVEDPVARARELIEHHRRRLDEAVRALGLEPRNAFEVSLALFGEGLDASNRRFALAETLAHLERLVQEGRVARTGDDSAVSYTAT